MAIRHGRPMLTSPRLLTFALSLLLALAALASMRVHLPFGQSLVAQHRFWIVVGAYALLSVGVLLPGL